MDKVSYVGRSIDLAVSQLILGACPSSSIQVTQGRPYHPSIMAPFGVFPTVGRPLMSLLPCTVAWD